jgi:hypothetical protein
MRLVTSPHQYLYHQYKKNPDDKKDFGQKVMCSMPHGSCPLCEAGDTAKPRWLIGVISRKTGTYKIIDIKYSVFSQIRKYSKNTQRWGDPVKYDIDIFVDKAGGPTGYYQVQPISKEPLSAEDQKIKDSADLEDLKRRITPPTVEQVKAKLEKLGAVLPTAQAATSAKSTSKQVDMSDDEDFPSYDAK